MRMLIDCETTTDYVIARRDMKCPDAAIWFPGQNH